MRRFRLQRNPNSIHFLITPVNLYNEFNPQILQCKGSVLLNLPSYY